VRLGLLFPGQGAQRPGMGPMARTLGRRVRDESTATDGRARALLTGEVTVAGAVLTGLLSVLLADWSTGARPPLPVAGFMAVNLLPGHVGGVPPWVLTVVVLLVAAPLLYAQAAAWGPRPVPSRVFLRTWGVVAAAWLAAAGVCEFVRLVFSREGPVLLLTEGVWAALSHAAFGGAYGGGMGWIVAAGVVLLVRRRAPDAEPVAAELTSWSPYVWVAVILMGLPLVGVTLGVAFGASATPSDCTASGCMPGEAGGIFFGEISLRILSPLCAAALVGLAALRRRGRIRRLRVPFQVLIGLGCGGLSFPLSGMLGA
jgi:hypothetical protein